MLQSQPQFRGGKTGAAITVQIIPQGKKNEIIGILEDGTIKIRLTAGKESNQINPELIRYLATVFDVTPAQIEIVAGENRPAKLISITGIDSDTAQQMILKVLG